MDWHLQTLRNFGAINHDYACSEAPGAGTTCALKNEYAADEFIVSGVTILTLLVLSATVDVAEASPQNWSGEYRPCNRHSDLLSREHLDLRVRFSTSNPVIARQFARALDFWAEVLDLEWHAADSLDCTIQVVDGTSGLFDAAGKGCIVARSQLPDRPAFQGWIAFNPRSRLTEYKMFEVSVHEIGHLPGLPHNPSGSSVMFFLELDDSVSLDAADLRALGARHKLRAGVFENAGVPVPSGQSAAPEVR